MILDAPSPGQDRTRTVPRRRRRSVRGEVAAQNAGPVVSIEMKDRSRRTRSMSAPGRKQPYAALYSHGLNATPARAGISDVGTTLTRDVGQRPYAGATIALQRPAVGER